MSKEKCCVCKREVEQGTGFVTENGPVCSSVCLDYLAEEKKRGNLNEGDGDQLNEVQMLL